jgi:uncharacterized protein
MTKEIWINLPVKNINRSKEFFSKIGFSLNEKYSGGADSASLLVGEKNIVVMLFAENTFKSYTKSEVADTTQGAEVLLSFDAASREEVDETARKVLEAGGTVFSEPEEIQGWMYGCAFADLDGHRWNALYMDFSKMPK